MPKFQLPSIFRRRPHRRKRLRCTALVPAAGGSVRMGGENKLLLPLCGAPVLVRTLTSLQLARRIDEIVIAAREEDLAEISRLCKDYHITKCTKVVLGGETRAHSVLLAAMEASKDSSLLAVHDGARPLVTPELIDRVVETAARTGAAAPAVAVKDTVKRVREGGAVEETLDRAALRAVQTPQVFEAGLLKGALQSAVEAGAEVTDDCAAVERIGKIVFLTDGEEENLKITTPLDLILARAILQQRMDAAASGEATETDSPEPDEEAEPNEAVTAEADVPADETGAAEADAAEDKAEISGDAAAEEASPADDGKPASGEAEASPKEGTSVPERVAEVLKEGAKVPGKAVEALKDAKVPEKAAEAFKEGAKVPGKAAKAIKVAKVPEKAAEALKEGAKVPGKAAKAIKDAKVPEKAAEALKEGAKVPGKAAKAIKDAKVPEKAAEALKEGVKVPGRAVEILKKGVKVPGNVAKRIGSRLASLRKRNPAKQEGAEEPEEEIRIPMEKARASAESASVAGESVPVNESVPVPEEAAPVEVSAPVSEEAVPVEESAPVSGETVAAEESVPTYEEAVPEESASEKEETSVS